MPEPHDKPKSTVASRALRAYLLGTLEFDDFFALQRRLVYEAGDERADASIVVCDHPPGITIGREGSRMDVRSSPEELHARGWPVRWVSRGGGALLHLPGQVACYPIVSLDAVCLKVVRYLAELQVVLVDLLAEYQLVGTLDADRPGVRVNGRRVAHVGVSVRDNVTCFGLVLNADPDLEPFRNIRCDGDFTPMTSLQREAAGRIRMPHVRQRLLELIAARFGFDRVSIFHAHPGALPQPTRYAAAQPS